MNRYIRTIITIALCGLYMTILAADQFIVKYKLNEDQKAYLAVHSGTDAEIQQAKAKIREELWKKLSKEQLEALSKAALDVKLTATKIQVTDSRPLAIGAHVITLSENLDKIQVEQFIRNVKKDNNIELIEEDKELSIS